MICFDVALDGKSSDLMQSLFRKHYMTMFRYAFSIVQSQDLAEDAVQSVFIKLSNHLHKFYEVESDQTKRYLITATRNVCYDLLKTPVHDDIDIDLSDGTSDPVWDQVHVREVIDDIRHVIERMRDVDKGIMIYRFAWHYSCKEIAELYNSSENYITARISRLRKVIKKELKPKWGDVNEFI